MQVLGYCGNPQVGRCTYCPAVLLNWGPEPENLSGAQDR